MNPRKKFIQVAYRFRLFAVVWAASAILCRMAHCQETGSASGKTGSIELDYDEKQFLYHEESEEKEKWKKKFASVYFEGGIVTVSDTRSPKDIRDVSSNIHIVTSEDIERHHWHFVGDILRHYGLLIFSTKDFGSPSIINIQGMEAINILIMLDGVKWRSMSAGDSETAGIPVDIIDRIEIVKGTASHAYGSALAGVINIITKTGHEAGKGPSGSVSTTYGERSILNTWARVAGKAWKAQYFFHVANQDSGLLEYDRSFENRNVYGKIAVPLSEDTKASVTAMFSAPYLGMGKYESVNYKFVLNQQIWLVKLNLCAKITDAVYMEFDTSHLEQKDVMMTDLIHPDSDFYSDDSAFEKRTGGNGKVVMETGRHTLVAGADIDSGNVRTLRVAGPDLQAYGVTERTSTVTDLVTWGLYANDTIKQHPWTFTVGFRYDDHKFSGSQTSHSLGLSWRGLESTIFRVNYAKGFSAPPTLWTASGWLFYDPNPNLGNEEVTSYQAGFESAGLKPLRIKGTWFYHDLENAFFRQWFFSDSGNYSKFVNQGGIQRTGFEFQAETDPVHDFTIRTGLSYTYSNNSNETETARTWIINLVLGYENDRLFSAHFLGNYVWTDMYDGDNPEYEIIFDLNIGTNVEIMEKIDTEVYFAAHNIFNSSQYTYDFRKNSGRWVEFGVKYHF